VITVSEPTLEDLHQWLTELSQLSKEWQAIAAPYQTQITLLESEMAQKTAALTFQMDTLQALIKPAILTLKQTQKVPYITVTYVNRPKWDKERLFAMAEEVPAIMQAYEDGSIVQFRKTSR
jgi:hypothetical protein